MLIPHARQIAEVCRVTRNNEGAEARPLPRIAKVPKESVNATYLQSQLRLARAKCRYTEEAAIISPKAAKGASPRHCPGGYRGGTLIAA